jgi:hypothetical protein
LAPAAVASRPEEVKVALTVVGAGFGRTGTLSLKLALEQLGLGRCYHMLEVFQSPGHTAQWQAAADGKRVDWDALFAGYGAAVDWPACHFWRALAAHYPEAKVLLTVREPGSWYKSVSDTIYQAMVRPLPAEAPPEVRAQLAMARKIVVEQTFGGRFEDRAHALAVYERHNEAVRREIPRERLLVYQVAEGWEPLCRFLGRPVPAAPFPRTNTTEDFLARFAAPPAR